MKIAFGSPGSPAVRSRRPAPVAWAVLDVGTSSRTDLTV